jgi:tRNA dimethylallyltransferase
MAIDLARKWDGEVINVDAYQVYDALPILSAAPTAAEMGEIPHHLVAVLSPSETCDAHRLAGMAKQKIRDVHARGRRPIVVGGGGLYMKAITHGLEAPPSDPGIRAELARLTAEERARRLQQLDPEAAASTDMDNDRYVTRNLEICLLTGRPLAASKQSWQQPPREPFEGAFLDWPREELYTRINDRTAAMFEAGVVEEVAAADLSGFSQTALMMLGLREIRAHLAGELSRDDAMQAIRQATRRYAKRQCTWFRKEPGFERIAMGGS